MTFESLKGKINVLEIVRQRVPGCTSSLLFRMYTWMVISVYVCMFPARYLMAATEPQQLDASVVPPTGVQLLRLLGAGAYGNLYVGRFRDIDDRGVDRCRPAFVKVLVDAPGPEVNRLLQLGHENIISLSAVVVGTDVGQPSCLVYDGVDDAVDLHQYLVLRRMRDESGEERADPDMVDWRQSVAVQVAKALDYLASVGLVHRDVAARNVIISTRKDGGVCPLSAKLSDFSLSRYPYSDDYFRFSDGADAGMPLPVRWLAPEALFSGRYSEASDAWSFGVMMWEMYCGQALTRPFEHHSDEQLIDAMAGRTGRRPALPCMRCSSSTYALMTECWKDMPVRRPRFSTILDRLREPGRDDPSSRDTSPAGGSDSTGVTVIASMSDSPHLSSRTSSFRAAHWPSNQTVWKASSAAALRRPFSPPSTRCLPRQPGSPLVPRSNSVTSANSATFGALM